MLVDWARYDGTEYLPIVVPAKAGIQQLSVASRMCRKDAGLLPSQERRETTRYFIRAAQSVRFRAAIAALRRCLIPQGKSAELAGHPMRHTALNLCGLES